MSEPTEAQIQRIARASFEGWHGPNSWDGNSRTHQSWLKMAAATLAEVDVLGPDEVAVPVTVLDDVIHSSYVSDRKEMLDPYLPKPDPKAEARKRLEQAALTAPVECEVSLVQFIEDHADDVRLLLEEGDDDR